MNKLKRLLTKRNFMDMGRGIKLLAIAAFCLFIRNKEKYSDLWIINERPMEARDNGYWLFKYIMDNNLHDNTRYIIKKRCADARKLEKYSHRLIEYQSLRHYVYYCLSSKQISTQLIFGSPSYSVAKYFKRIMPVKKSYVYLGHGIHKDDVEFLYKKNSKIDLFITDNDHEVKECLEVGGYREENVVLTGRPRNDGLNDFVSRKEILIMPTNRIWFDDWKRDERSENFLKSRFSKEYQELLYDKDLQKLLKESGYRLLFYLHTNSRWVFKHFKSDCEDIILVDINNIGVQEVLKRGAMLITDYSSVAFDFGYMYKPVIYFQYDYGTFREKQYKEGWFSYQEHGLGDIIDNRKALVERISAILQSGCKMDDKYKKRVAYIYYYRDSENCSRVFNSIMNMNK